MCCHYCMQDQNLESAKGEKGETREENKMLEFYGIRHHDKPDDATNAKGVFSHIEENEESELVSLSLGISISKGKPTKDEKILKNKNGIEKTEDEDVHNKRLVLGLDINLDPVDQDELAANNSTPESSFGEGGKEDEPTEMWPPSKVSKTMKSVDKSEVSQHDQPKKTRVSIRARCDTQTVSNMFID